MSDTETTKPGTDIALLPPAERALVVLKSTATEEALKALILRTSAIIAPPVDKAGREEVHRAAMDHKNARLAIEKAGKAATEDAKEFTKSVSAEQKRLIALNAEEEARLFKLRDDYDAAEAARKAEDERKERERVRMIRVNIDQIKSLPVDSAADDAETLAATLDDLRAFEITFEDFAEFQDEARAARDAAIGSLTTMHGHAVAREAAAAAAREAEEKLAAQRAELERQQQELARQREELAQQQAELEAAKAVQVVKAPVVEEAGAFKAWASRALDGPAAAAPTMLNDEGMIPRPDLECAHETLFSDGRCTECGEMCAVLPDHIPLEPAQIDGMKFVTADPLDPGHWRDMEPADLAKDNAARGTVFTDAAMITIPLSEYEELKTRVRWLECLEGAGVDNWEGIDEALRLNREGAAS